MSCVAIIPARIGSKRIPKKNIKEFCGRPIICYSIENAINSGVFDDVIVSTDSEEIAEIARECGACVPFLRDKDLADDYTTTDDVVLDALTYLMEHGKQYDYFACIYATAPFMDDVKMKEAMEFLINADADEIMTVAKYSSPPQRALVLKNGILFRKQPEYRMTRSQDLETLYYDAGQFYAYKTKTYFKCQGVIGENIIPYILPAIAVQDIDSLEDWEFAEMKYRFLTDKNTWS